MPHTFCSTEAPVWVAVPAQSTLGGIPLTVHHEVLRYILDTQVQPLLEDHVCDIRDPCVVLAKLPQIIYPLASTCKLWEDLVDRFLTEAADSSLGLTRNSRNQLLSEDKYYFRVKAVADTTLNGRYTARECSTLETDGGKGVFHAYDYGGPAGCKGKTRVILKLSNKLETHDNECDVYDWLSTPNDPFDNVPKLFYRGSYCLRNYNGLVLSKLGPDLETLCSRASRFTPKQTLAVAIQTISIYKRLHAKGWLHCNAKPGNFAIGPNKPVEKNKIFMFNFEFSTRIGPNPEKLNRTGKWNYGFVPVTWQQNLTPSRRDDLEGLGYVWSYLERGCLPWNDDQCSESIWLRKLRTPSTVLFEGMDPVYVQYFNRVKALAWGEVPDYDDIIQEFLNVWDSKGYTGTPWEIDWWAEFKKFKRNADDD